VDLSELNVVLASRYDDDEPGSPWDFYLYLDERGDERQRDALRRIFLGELGGTPLKQFPWAFKGSNLLGVRVAPIEIEHVPGRGWFRARGQVSVRISGPVAVEEPVTCVIPGHHQPGREVYTERLVVDDAPLAFELTGNCGYESNFAYSSGDS